MSTAKITVIGDAMLDTYIYGTVSRVSPEAPVPVIKPYKKEYRLGGAANAACNAAALEAEVSAFFVFGDDARGNTARKKLTDFGIYCGGSLFEKDIYTTEKIRVIGNLQQIARIDEHDSVNLTEEMRDRLITSAKKAIKERDAVVISDYGKGVCTPYLCGSIIDFCKKEGKPVIVDPKGTDWSKYRGASVLTPNLKEINRFSGKDVENDDKSIEDGYSDICRIAGVDFILLTRSEKGVTLLGAGEPVHIPAQAREVYDVSGAGDTVAATLAVMLAKGAGLAEAIQVANLAAGVVVGKRGTACATWDEIRNRQKYSFSDRIFTRYGSDFGDFRKLLDRWRKNGDRIVTTNGCFDILHTGHIRLLTAAKSFGDRLVVAVNSDESVKRLKGPGRPVNPDSDRANILRALGMVDAVVIFDPEKEPYTPGPEEIAKLSEKALGLAATAPMALIKLIHPDVHVKGGDYLPRDIPEGIFAGRTETVKTVEGYSTTTLLERVKNERD